MNSRKTIIEQGSGYPSKLKTIVTFLQKGTCSETMISVLNRVYGHSMSAEEQAAGPLAGGILLYGYQCGLLWGAALAAGAQAFRRSGPGPSAEIAAITASQRLTAIFHERFKHLNCRELTSTNWRSKKQRLAYAIRGGPLHCMRIAAAFAPDAYREINAALAEMPAPPPPPPLSCSALLAREMGLSGLHQVMVAGLAGGIGFSGGACGAAGAAVWIAAIAGLREGTWNKVIESRIKAAMEAFSDHTGGRFECRSIAGRRFENIADHAGYLRTGGCAQLIALLAASFRAAPVAQRPR